MRVLRRRKEEAVARGKRRGGGDLIQIFFLVSKLDEKEIEGEEERDRQIVIKKKDG
jgi:hypothetical protein